jgi:hypothetical protein
LIRIFSIQVVEMFVFLCQIWAELALVSGVNQFKSSARKVFLSAVSERYEYDFVEVLSCFLVNSPLLNSQVDVNVPVDLLV